VEFEVRSLSPVGVEILGLDLRRPIAGAALADLRQVVLDAGVAVLREQSLTAAEQVAFGRCLGTIERGAVNDRTPDPDVILLSNVGADGRVLGADDPGMKLVAINEGWHTDSSFRTVPASFSTLSAVVVPTTGGDTLFASLQAAWQALGASEQASLYGLLGIHDYVAAYRKRAGRPGGAAPFDLPPVPHPLARRHPETGATVLFVSEHVGGIEGWAEGEAEPLLQHLLEVCTAPERVYRHRWSVGDLLIWDNRSMLHRTLGFDAHQPRVMHHVRIGGTEPALAATPA
jgi:taurine dioxygenase